MEREKANWEQVAEIELVYKSKVKASERPEISSSSQCYNVLMSVWDMDKIELVEQFKVLLLNRSNRVLGVIELSSGGITGTVADPRHILCAAIKANACSIILAHNHPSGSLRASKADEELTYKIKEAAGYHDIKVLDHLIVHTEGYISFADEGLL